MTQDRIIHDQGRDAFDFIDAVSDLHDPDEIIARFHRAVARYGYATFIITGLPGLTEPFETRVLTRHWPDAWFRIYAAETYILDDPVGWHCRVAPAPFAWSEAPFDPGRQPRSRRIMEEAASFGMKDGLCVPVHGLQGLDWCVSLGGPDPDLSPRARAAVHLMALYAFDGLRRRLLNPDPPPPRRLTAREREVIAWTAAGKSAWEASCILGIAEDTVNKHAASAARKLNAANKTQAVAEAIRRHEIPW
ncbi:LuxR family transcriptional regulator [Tistrella mobilis]